MSNAYAKATKLTGNTADLLIQLLETRLGFGLAYLASLVTYQLAVALGAG